MPGTFAITPRAATMAACAAAFATTLVFTPPVEAAVGDLTYRNCITGQTQTGPAPSGSGACEAVPSVASGGLNSGLNGTIEIAQSSDGASVYALTIDDSIARFDRNLATGALQYRNCLSAKTENGPGGSGACAELPSATSFAVESGLDVSSHSRLEMSPDGKSLYAISTDDDSIATFDRDPDNGALEYAGCITGETETGPAGTDACAAIGTADAGGADSGMDGPRALAVSPDGDHVYVGTGLDDSLVLFDRGADGSLTYRECLTAQPESGPTGSGACAALPADNLNADGGETGFNTITKIELSADGRSLYGVAVDDDSVFGFDRDEGTGELTFRECLTGETHTGPAPGGSGACGTIPSANFPGAGSGLGQPQGLAMSADGRSLYAYGTDDAIARFDRDRQSGDLEYRGCLTGDSDFGPGGNGACAAIPSATAGGTDSGLGTFGGRSSLAISPDGSSVYAAAPGDASVASFDRDRQTGALGFGGCLTGDDGNGPTGTGACETITSATGIGFASGLWGPHDILASPDGRSIYVGAFSDDSVARFDRERDTESPQTQILTGPTGTTSDATPTFTFTADEPGSAFECAVDSGEFGACSGPGNSHTTAPLADGPHAFLVRATDTAGNVDPTPAVRTFTVATPVAPAAPGPDPAPDPTPEPAPDGDPAPAVDTEPPETAIDAKPKRRSPKRRPTFEFSSTEPGSTFECRIDREEFKECTSPAKLGRLSLGKHRFQARAVDAAGNVDASPASYRWRIVRRKN